MKRRIGTRLHQSHDDVTGGLGVGISSTIAGGNFWDGFRQGIITSGLYHVAHLEAEALQKGSSVKVYDSDYKD